MPLFKFLPERMVMSSSIWRVLMVFISSLLMHMENLSPHTSIMEWMSRQTSKRNIQTSWNKLNYFYLPFSVNCAELRYLWFALEAQELKKKNMKTKWTKFECILYCAVFWLTHNLLLIWADFLLSNFCKGLYIACWKYKRNNLVKLSC